MRSEAPVIGMQEMIVTEEIRRENRANSELSGQDISLSLYGFSL